VALRLRLDSAGVRPQDAEDFHHDYSRRTKGQPGEIMRVDRHGILVAAKVGGLLLREVQLEGKKRMHAAEFARGFNLPVGWCWSRIETYDPGIVSTFLSSRFA